MSRQSRVKLFTLIVVSGMMAAALFHSYQGYIRHQPYPYNTFLFTPDDAFMDFYNILIAVRTGNPYGYFTSVYPPFAYVLVMPFSQMENWAAFFSFISVFLMGGCIFVYRQLSFLPWQKRLACILAIGFSYPSLICFSRGNLEVYVFLLLCGAVISYQRNAWMACALFIAAATAMKIYPAIFVLLLLKKRLWKPAAVAVAGAALLSLGSAACYPGGITGSIQQFGLRLGQFTEHYAYLDWGLRFSVNLYSPAKLGLQMQGLYTLANAASVYKVYTLICLVLFTGMAAVILFKPLSFWRQTALLCFAMLLLPQVSFDYKLIHLLLPAALFLADEEASAYDLAYTVLFALLFIPKSYFWIQRDITIAVVINPALMVIFCVLMLKEAFQKKPQVSETSATSPLSLNTST